MRYGSWPIAITHPQMGNEQLLAEVSICKQTIAFGNVKRRSASSHLRHLWRAILRLPRAVGLMLGTLFQVKKANKTFIHTVHTKTEVSNYLFTENKHKNG